MVRVLLIAATGLAIVGLFDLIRLRTPESAFQSAASGALALLTLWMDRTRRPHPRTILVVAALAGYASILFASIEEDHLRLTDSSPTVIIAITGILALILGGKWAKNVAVFWSGLLIVGVATARWPVTQSVSQVITDTATVLIITALAFGAALAVRHASQQGQLEYERLLRTAPVGVVEFDLRGVARLLEEHRITTIDQLDAAIRRGDLDPALIVQEVNVTSSNEIGRHDLALRPAARADQDMSGQQAWAIATVLARMVFEDDSGTLELEFIADDGSAVQRVMNWNINSQDRRDVVVVTTDITAQKQAERALADQIRYKDEFIASVSHELRTPLTAVVGLVDEMARHGSPIAAPERDELLSIVSEQSHEVADIVEDLLVAARAAGGNLSTHPVDVKVSEIVETTLQMFKQDFALELEDGLSAHADPIRTRQIIRNLATNAVRYGGGHRMIAAYSEGSMAVIEVRDNGGPIPTERREQMFDPYERARPTSDSRPDSVGLGLTVARSLARTMGGDLTYAHDGDESIFRLTVPARALASR